MEKLVVQLVKENTGWGYDRLVGALANLGYQVSDQTVGNILRRHGLEPLRRGWIRSVKTEQLILFGQRSLAYALQEYLKHHQKERNHQGLDNLIPFPDERLSQKEGSIKKAERLGGLLKFYYRAAA